MASVKFYYLDFDDGLSIILLFGPGRGHWDSTSDGAALLLTACMTDIVYDDLGHVTTCMGKIPFCTLTLAGCASVCLSATLCIFLQKMTILKKL